MSDSTQLQCYLLELIEDIRIKFANVYDQFWQISLLDVEYSWLQSTRTSLRCATTLKLALFYISQTNLLELIVDVRTFDAYVFDQFKQISLEL